MTVFNCNKIQLAQSIAEFNELITIHTDEILPTVITSTIHHFINSHGYMFMYVSWRYNESLIYILPESSAREDILYKNSENVITNITYQEFYKIINNITLNLTVKKENRPEWFQKLNIKDLEITIIQESDIEIDNFENINSNYLWHLHAKALYQMIKGKDTNSAFSLKLDTESLESKISETPRATISIDQLRKDLNQAMGIGTTVKQPVIEKPIMNKKKCFNDNFNFDAPTLKVLNKWFVDNFEIPYPKTNEKEKICEDAFVSIAQLNDWFSKMRTEIWPRLKQKKEQALKDKIELDLLDEIIKLQFNKIQSEDNLPTSSKVKITLTLDEVDQLMDQGTTYQSEGRYEEAYKCYYQAYFNGGNIKARTNLAFFHLKGLGGVTKDKVYAMKLLEESSQDGHARAQINYARVLEASKDLVEAEKWYKKAADLGEPKAIERMIQFQNEKLDKAIPIFPSHIDMSEVIRDISIQTVKIYIYLPNYTNQLFEMKINDTIGKLKSEISDLINLPIEEQILFFGDTELSQNNFALVSYNIINESKLKLKLTKATNL